MFNVDSNKMETLNFLRLNINDSYNDDMGHVDVSDQLREVYKFNSWLRNYKWWWSIMQWGIGVLLVNTYVVYKKVCEEDGVRPMSHCDFRKEIALSWIHKMEPTIAEHRRARARETPNTPHNQRKRSTMSMSNERPPKRQRSTPPSASSTASSKAPTKAHHLNDQSIDNPAGPFARRLDRFCDHYPTMPGEERPKCALHRYVGKIEERKQVYKCGFCKINLCIDCFKMFHTRPHMKENKEKLAMMMRSVRKMINRGRKLKSNL